MAAANCPSPLITVMRLGSFGLGIGYGFVRHIYLTTTAPASHATHETAVPAAAASTSNTDASNWSLEEALKSNETLDVWLKAVAK